MRELEATRTVAPPPGPRARGRAIVRRVPARSGRRPTDAGFSAVDIIIAITLLGVVIIPMIHTVFAAVAASSTAREVAELETVLQNAADRVNRAPTGCDYTIYVQAAVLAKGWPADRASATYQYYVPGPSLAPSDAGTWQPGACPNGVRTPGLIQLVTVRVESDSGHTSRTLKVVKSDV